MSKYGADVVAEALPGAFDNTAVNEGTEFFCTSLKTAKIVHLGVELRDAVNQPRNPGANNGAIAIAPGQTVTIGTHDSPAFDEDVVHSLVLTGSTSDGSARIWSNSVKVMCSALLIRDAVAMGPRGPGSDGPAPTGMVELKVVKAKFQTGD